MAYPAPGMSQNPAPPPPPESLQAFCLDVLRRGDLETKLRPPTGPAGSALRDEPGEPILDIDRPARDAPLAMGPGGGALPAPGSLANADARRECLSRFAHHELQAVEYFAWALLRWPDAPLELRRGLVSALGDEQRHCRLYLDRLEALGGHFESGDHSDYFWQQAPAIAASEAGLRAFLSAMGLTLEQANLDFTLTYRDAFRDAGDEESAEICQVVHDDEVAHVALAVRWLRRLSGGEDAKDADLRDYLETVPFPLGPARAKGRRFDSAPRKRAGLSTALIDHVREARVGERDATPIDLVPNLGAEEGEDARAYRDQAPVRTAAHLWALLPAPRATRRRSGCRGSPRYTISVAQAARRALIRRGLRLPGRAGPPCLAHDGDRGRALPATYRRGAGAEVVARSTTRPSPPARPSPRSRPPHPRASRRDPRARRARESEALGRVLSIASRRGPMDRAPAGTLKPRHGSSGGAASEDGRDRTRAPRRAAAPRGARRRDLRAVADRTDLSVSLTSRRRKRTPLVVLGSLEMWTTASGGYRGHFGEVDHRGRVFSGDPGDETLRGEAAALAARARAEGFFGPCGVDAFRYRQPTPGGAPIERLRGAVEFNARSTMGLVAIGLVKRAFPRVRKRLGLQPGERHGFALTHRAADDTTWRARIYEHVGNDAAIVDLAEASGPGDPRASLVFSRDPASIRAARSRAFGC